MPVEAPPRTWIQLYGGLELSTERLRTPEGELFRTQHAARMDIDAFNRETDRLDHMKESDPPFLRLLKYAESLSRIYKDGSFVPTNREYIDALLMAGTRLHSPDTAAYPSFWTLFNGDVVDITRDVIKILDEKHGRYEVQLHRFNCGVLTPVGRPFTIGSNGWIRSIGALHGYPIETSDEYGPVNNIEHTCDQAIGTGRIRLSIGINLGYPTNDNVQFATHHPSVNTGGMDMGFYPLECKDDDMGAILLRRQGIKDPI